LPDITKRKRLKFNRRQQAERDRLLEAIAIRQSLNLAEILNTTVEEVRQFLQADRVMIIALMQIKMEYLLQNQ